MLCESKGDELLTFTFSQLMSMMIGGGFLAFAVNFDQYELFPNMNCVMSQKVYSFMMQQEIEFHFFQL